MTMDFFFINQLCKFIIHFPDTTLNENLIKRHETLYTCLCINFGTFKVEHAITIISMFILVKNLKN